MNMTTASDTKDSMAIVADDELPRILCVDDEPRVLAALQRTLGFDYQVHVASGGAAGLAVLRDHGPFVTVISDMLMPGMDGVTFLGRARVTAPDTVRILLTGNADLETAIKAVNEGHIFRFLRKPCPDASLRQILRHAVIQYRLVTRDRDLIKAEVERLQDQILRTDRLATLGTLARGAGHDLNNITTSLVCYHEMVQHSARQGIAPDPEDLEEITEAIERLKQHGTHLMELGRPLAQTSELLDLRDIISRTVAMLQRTGRFRLIAIEVVLPKRPVPVFVDRTRIEQILINLLINAYDAVVQSKDSRAISLNLDVSATAQTCRCEVVDHGCGMSPQTLARVFDAYFTTKQPGQGTGLGLPVVKQIIESYDGRVSMTSEPGSGTTFSFDLPLATVDQQKKSNSADIASVRAVAS